MALRDAAKCTKFLIYWMYDFQLYHYSLQLSYTNIVLSQWDPRVQSCIYTHSAYLPRSSIYIVQFYLTIKSISDRLFRRRRDFFFSYSAAECLFFTFYVYTDADDSVIGGGGDSI